MKIAKILAWAWLTFSAGGLLGFTAWRTAVGDYAPLVIVGTLFVVAFTVVSVAVLGLSRND